MMKYDLNTIEVVNERISDDILQDNERILNIVITRQAISAFGIVKRGNDSFKIRCYLNNKYFYTADVASFKTLKEAEKCYGVLKTWYNGFYKKG